MFYEYCSSCNYINWDIYVIPHIKKMKSKFTNYDTVFHKHRQYGINRYNYKKAYYEDCIKLHSYGNLNCDEINALKNDDIDYFVIDYFKKLKEKDY
jgi:hypothetical protein